MENLGKTFKELRISRKLTLQEIANDEFSISMLSKFENGKTEISVNKLNMALSNLHMSINEFYYLYVCEWLL
ncbi:helix-turn-helix transcriptional regulator [Helcococcus kunzii]|uniref:helix-turn-helix domain-containing protein n=1 Tax=Helcococcus kunzii TaxID=40091 RepID=UPI001C9466E3|nr:helix-turn-helix transcriptional regulator [Helcococcus kunzii]QZO75890.1 helix-turn-helix transcriptional regulator [Helcococcus kunzii]